MKLEWRVMYLEKILQRYRRSSRKSKGKLLDEICQVCGYNRKYAIWRLNRLLFDGKRKGSGKRRRRKKYDLEVLAILEAVWEAANNPWSVRLKEIIRLWLPWIKERFVVDPDVEAKLLSISPSTIDRLLKPQKMKFKRRLYGRTKPGTLLRHKIPVKCDNWDVDRPGFLEVDLLSHSGGSGSGEFIYSLNLTDIQSGWVETRAVMGKGQEGILGSFEDISPVLPFRILGIDSDNGSEFINRHLLKYCEDNEIQFTRSRPYKKDDNAHIEQKNWTHVRKFMGWDRYDSPEAQEAMNALYTEELPLFMNMLMPSVKLVKIIRRGSRRRKIYDKPQTPLDRLLASGTLDQKKSDELIAIRENLDPFALSKTIDKKLQLIWSLANYRYQPAKSQNVSESKPDELSAVEKETLDAISQMFGINVQIKKQNNETQATLKQG